MNGDDTDSGIAHTEAWPVALEGSSPNWLEDGYGIQGPQGEVGEEDVQDWDTNAWSDNTQANEDFINGPPTGCLTDAGPPPGSGTHILGSVDGTCQWIDTTTCA